MNFSEHVQVWGLIFFGIVLIGSLIASVYFSLRKRPVEITVLALVIMLFASFFVWLQTKDYGGGPHSPMMLILPLVVLPMACIIIGILLALMSQYFRSRKLQK